MIPVKITNARMTMATGGSCLVIIIDLLLLLLLLLLLHMCLRACP